MSFKSVEGGQESTYAYRAHNNGALLLGVLCCTSDKGERMPTPSPSKPPLTISLLQQEAKAFSTSESTHEEPTLFGVTDGKAIGTYLEQKFQQTLWIKYEPDHGNSAKGIDFPGINVDVKVTSIKQPQSSCPFKSAREKVYGLGYSLIVFVYEKTDDPKLKTARLNILHSVFIEPQRTGDFQLTRAILGILENNGNADDLVACMMDKNLPVDEIQAQQLAEEILGKPPMQGYLTISNALQWRLQYARIIEYAGSIDGIIRIK